MSKQLVESIIDKDFVLAESHFNDVLNNIMEKKLYEKKRMIAAKMDEALGRLTRDEIEAKKKAGYRKAADVLGDPRDIKTKPLVKVKKIKKKVSEAVEVKADPEGRVRGGKAQPAKKSGGVISSVRRLIGKQKGLGKGAAIAHAMSPEERKSFRQKYKAARLVPDEDKMAAKAAGAGPSHPKEPEAPRATPAKTPWLKRNVNTALGRDPDYDSKAPENQSRGGRAGKVARGIVRGVVSDLLAAARP